MGFVMYPGVPNTTAVSQETDQAYGLFKSIFRENLDNISSDRKRLNKPLNFPPSLVGLFVFGGTDPVTNLSGYRNAFSIAFSKEKCLHSWEKVGAAPFTMACLKSHKIRHEILEKVRYEYNPDSFNNGDSDDEEDNPTVREFKRMQQKNIMCVSLLNQQGYEGNKLKATLKEQKQSTEQTLTVPHSQERVEAIMHCKTHGQSFMATGGMPITADETFLAAEQEKKKNEIRNIQVDKLKRMEAEKREAAAFKIIEKEIQTKDLKVENLNVLLAWHQVKLTGMSKAQKLSKWETIKETNKPPPTYQKWTEEDERKLNEKKDKTIELGDTALGRFQDRKRKEMEESFKSATKEEQEEMLKKLKAIVDE